MMLSVGRSVDRYVVDQVIGEGGMAVVYRVRHSTLGTWHALKVLTITSLDVRQRLIQEGRVQATLQHPNIVAVTDVLEIGDAPGLLMEYVSGPSLERLLRHHRPSREEALTIFRGICAGVAHAHSRGLVHRDLKPANVLLQLTDHGVVAKVTDFGLAKALQRGAATRTRTGATMGTPAYMPPEQISDASKVDRRADMYALGCILYELLCGRMVYEGTDMLALFKAIGAGDHPDPRELVPDLPSHLARALDSLLAVDPARRIPDCPALLEVLDGRDEVTSLMVPAGSELPPAQSLGPELGASYLPSSSPSATFVQALVTALPDETPAPPAPMQETGETWAGTASGLGIDRTLLSDEPTGPLPPAVPPRAEDLPLAGSSLPPRVRAWWVPWAVVSGVLAVLAAAGAGAVAGGSAVAGGALMFWGSDPAPTQVDGSAGDAVPTLGDVENAEGSEVASPTEGVGRTADAGEADSRDDAPSSGPAGTDEGRTPATPPAPTTRPAPAPRPRAQPRPKPAPVATARFTFVDAHQVVLVAADGRTYKAGQPVPPGEYQVLAAFTDTEALAGAGQVTLRAGDAVSLRCNARVYRCRS